MRRRLLNKVHCDITPSFDPVYRRVLRYACKKNISFPSESQQIIQNQLVLDLKSNGLWDLFDMFYLFMNDSGLEYSAINWANPYLYSLSYDGLIDTHVTNDRVEFESSADSNFNPKDHAINYKLNDCSFGYYIVDRTDFDANDSVLVSANTFEPNSSVSQTQDDPASIIGGFNSYILVNKAGTAQNTLLSGAGNAYRDLNVLHSIELLNDTASYYYNNTLYGNSVTNIPTELPDQTFKIHNNASTSSYSFWYAGSHLSLAQKGTLKTLLDDYKTDINL